MAKQKQEECKSGAPEWMATYGDLVTLLMCFFVLLFAFSSIDAQKFAAVMQSFQGSAGILSGGRTLSNAPLVFDAMPFEAATSGERIDNAQLEELKHEIEKFVDEEELQSLITVFIDDRGIVLRVKDGLLFDENSSVLKESGIPLLNKIIEVIKSDKHKGRSLLVEGHTDNHLVPSELFQSNWEYTTSRASSVVKYLLRDRAISPYRISAVGYAEFRPIATNYTRQGREMNRRIEVIILRNAKQVTGGNID